MGDGEHSDGILQATDIRSFAKNGPDNLLIRSIEAVDWSFGDAITRLAGHDIHPYPARYIPQIPAGLIERLTKHGETVLDPFGGSGTTALEALRLGRTAISLDANPLSALIGTVKTTKLTSTDHHELHMLHGALSAAFESGGVAVSATIEELGPAGPIIPNRSKWFADEAYAELLFIKDRIARLQSDAARDVSLVAFSRTVIQASFQDSETRYKSVPRDVPNGETLKRYLREFHRVRDSLARLAAGTFGARPTFVFADARHVSESMVPSSSVDAIITSPPYGNATDYHLYHRFRLLWLGYDPGALGKVEIGSHLKHQREASGFDSYVNDMGLALASMARVLRPGRHAALVIGDSVYSGIRHDAADAIADAALEHGFERLVRIDRTVHAVKRSFSHAGRRATEEAILVLRRKPAPLQIDLLPPPYKLWPFEAELRRREIGAPTIQGRSEGLMTLETDEETRSRLGSLAFTHTIRVDDGQPTATWQAVLENGGASKPSSRKDPKYVTHGIHSYKGKFYPQLAKSLINLACLDPGSTVLDPFCGSGTTLLEAYLGGHTPRGCDMNPVAAKIARAKVGILEIAPATVVEITDALLEELFSAPKTFPTLRNVAADCHDEATRWFAQPVLLKIDWLLGAIRRASAGAVLDYLETLLSSIIREVSQQDPTDLRIRYRKQALDDADVLGLFEQRLRGQQQRLEKFWRVRNLAPAPFVSPLIVTGDNREPAVYDALAVSEGGADCILTSPPYATALPYIDTDRLSILILNGLNSSERRPLEFNLTGSREISPAHRQALEAREARAELPRSSRTFVTRMSNALAKDRDAGFRRRNAPALLTRYLVDMQSAFTRCHDACRSDASMMVVMGDNRISIGGDWMRIPSTRLLRDIALEVGFSLVEEIPLTVTTERMMHMRNAITDNTVLRFRKP